LNFNFKLIEHHIQEITMKNKILYTTLLLSLLFTIQACNDVLDNPEPSTSIDQGVALSDPGAVRAVRASMYSSFHSFTFTTLNMIGPDALGDNTFNRLGSSRFQGLAQNQPRADLLNRSFIFDTINKANLIIEAIATDQLSPEEVTTFRGEAHFVRAYAMHYLVRVLGYDPGAIPSVGQGAGWDRGIILRTTPTLDVAEADERARSSVEEVYNQIESDITDSISLLSQSQGPSRNFIRVEAAQALGARVYLYWKKYNEANSFAQDALGNTGANLVGPSDVGDIWTPSNPEAIFITLINPDTETQGVNSSLSAYTSQQWVAQVPTPDLISIYDENDARNDWFGPCFDEINGTDLEDSCPAGLELQKWTGVKGNFTDDVPLFRVPEMLLIQAEALLNTSGIGAALGPLNLLRDSRGLDLLDAADFASNEDLLDEILDERRRELVGEGHRFFDLKRLGRDIRKDPSLGFPDVPFTDRRILGVISDNDLETNPLLEQNPGW